MGVSGGPDIIQDGLLIALDASDRNSYASGSTIWNDLSGNGNHFNLLNTPTYATEGLGGLTLNGTNQYAASVKTFTVPSEITIISTIRKNGAPSGNFPAIFQCGTGDFTNSTGNGVIFTYPYVTTDQIVFSSYGNGTSAGYTQVTSPSGSITIMATAMSSTGKATYTNGVLRGTQSTSLGTPTFTGTAYIGNWATYSRYMNGTIFNQYVYNRILSVAEIQQNYAAIKTRFGLT
jgi:hypothetical protein